LSFTIWQLVIVIIASGMILLSFLCVIFPQRLVDAMPMLAHSKLAQYSDIVIRVLLGISLIFSAPTAKFPGFYFVFGYISLLAAFSITIVSTRKLESVIKFLTKLLPLWSVRLVCAFSVVFFTFLIDCIE
jgi:hypothetical protein